MKIFSYDISLKLRKKLSKLAVKDKVLARVFYRKVKEIVSRDSVDMYKNLKSPLNSYKRIHLTDNYILLFAVKKKHIVFLDIRHWDDCY